MAWRSGYGVDRVLYGRPAYCLRMNFMAMGNGGKEAPAFDYLEGLEYESSDLPHCGRPHMSRGAENIGISFSIHSFR